LAPTTNAVIKRLKTQNGRDFTIAVLDAFEHLGFEVEDIEETQGTQAHSDLIVKSHLATNPYFAVLECTAVRQGSQIGYTKLYQLGSNFPRYLTKYGKHHPFASYKMLVGRPEFSSDTKKLAKDTVLMTTKILIRLLEAQEEVHLSQDELEKVFQQTGEITDEDLFQLFAPYTIKAVVYGYMFLSLLEDPTDKSIRRKKEWTNIERLIAMTKHWGWLLDDFKVSEAMITEAINELSSDVVRALLIDRQKIMLSSLPFKKIVQNMGDLGEMFERFLMTNIDKAAKLKRSSKT
jgi:hypothetical protein